MKAIISETHNHKIDWRIQIIYLTICLKGGIEIFMIAYLRFFYIKTDIFSNPSPAIYLLNQFHFKHFVYINFDSSCQNVNFIFIRSLKVNIILEF